MKLYCESCGKIVNAQKFKRFFDKEKKDFKEEYYCPFCLETIYYRKLKESNMEE